MCPGVLSGTSLWPSEPAAGRGEPEISEVLRRGENWRCTLVICIEQGVWPMNLASDVAESQKLAEGLDILNMHGSAQPKVNATPIFQVRVPPCPGCSWDS